MSSSLSNAFQCTVIVHADNRYGIVERISLLWIIVVYSSICAHLQATVKVPDVPVKEEIEPIRGFESPKYLTR